MSDEPSLEQILGEFGIELATVFAVFNPQKGLRTWVDPQDSKPVCGVGEEIQMHPLLILSKDIPIDNAQAARLVMEYNNTIRHVMVSMKVGDELKSQLYVKDRSGNIIAEDPFGNFIDKSTYESLGPEARADVRTRLLKSRETVSKVKRSELPLQRDTEVPGVDSQPQNIRFLEPITDGEEVIDPVEIVEDDTSEDFSFDLEEKMVSVLDNYDKIPPLGDDQRSKITEKIAKPTDVVAPSKKDDYSIRLELSGEFNTSLFPKSPLDDTVLVHFAGYPEKNVNSDEEYETDDGVDLTSDDDEFAFVDLEGIVPKETKFLHVTNTGEVVGDLKVEDSVPDNSEDPKPLSSIPKTERYPAVPERVVGADTSHINSSGNEDLGFNPSDAAFGFADLSEAPTSKGIPVSAEDVNAAKESVVVNEHEKQKDKITPKEVKVGIKVIKSLRMSGWAYVYHDFYANDKRLGSYGLFVRRSAAKIVDGEISSPGLFDLLEKAEVVSEKFVFTTSARMGNDISPLLKLDPEKAHYQLLAHLADVYQSEIHKNSKLSDEEKKFIRENWGIDGVSNKKNLSWLRRIAAAAMISVGLGSIGFGLASYLEVRQNLASEDSENAASLEESVSKLTIERDSALSRRIELEGDLASLKDKLDDQTLFSNGLQSKLGEKGKEYASLVMKYNFAVWAESEARSNLNRVLSQKAFVEKRLESSEENFNGLSERYESLKDEELKLRAHLESAQKEKDSLDALLRKSQIALDEKEEELKNGKSSYDAKIKELNDKYASYLPPETVAELVRKGTDEKVKIFISEIERLDGLVKKYENLGSYNDVKSAVEKNKKVSAEDVKRSLKTFSELLDTHPLIYDGRDDVIERKIACACLTRAALASDEELKVWLRFGRLVERSEFKGEFGLTQDDSALVAAKFIESVAELGAFDDKSFNGLFEKYKALRGPKSVEKSYNKTCEAAAQTLLASLTK